MHAHTFEYPPINTLKPVAEDVWIVDGPIIRFGPRWLQMPFPTRMTIVRTGNGSLFIHSPTPLVPDLRAAVSKLGVPRWIVGPNRIHYSWIPDWHAAYGDADVYLAPRIREQAKGRIDFVTKELDGASGYPWDNEIATLPVSGSYMTEFEFFHWRSRTLILTDLIENFEPKKMQGWWMRWLTRLGGVQDPDGKTPRDMRLTFRSREIELRQAVKMMIAWKPVRIILAHGRWYQANAEAELRRAFRGVLDD
jgi:hypothetical protein